MGTLMAGAFFIGAAQNVMAPNLTKIAADFGLSPEDRDVVLGGWMSSAFFLVGAPMSVCAGVLADRTVRTRQFRYVLAAAAVAIGLNSVAFSIWQLLLLRVLLGVLYGTLNPILFSIVGDLFPPTMRSALAAYVGLAIGGGTAVGQLGAGLFSRFGWRAPYIVISAGCALAWIAVSTFAREPARGQADAETTTAVSSPGHHTPLQSEPPAHAGEDERRHVAVHPPQPSLRLADLGSLLVETISTMRIQFRRIINIRTNQFIYLQALYGTVPWSVITVFLNDYLSQEIGLSVPRATFLVLLFGIGAAVGGVVGGTAGTALYRRAPHSVPLVFGCTQALAALPMMWLINMPRVQSDASGSSFAIIYAMAVLSGLVASATGPNLKAMLMNVNVPDTRGSVFTFQYVFDSFAKGVAPYIIGVLIGHTGQRARIFNVAMFGWVLSGVLIAATASSIARDESEAHSKAAARALTSTLPPGTQVAGAKDGAGASTAVMVDAHGDDKTS